MSTVMMVAPRTNQPGATVIGPVTAAPYVIGSDYFVAVDSKDVIGFVAQGFEVLAALSQILAALQGDGAGNLKVAFQDGGKQTATLTALNQALTSADLGSGGYTSCSAQFVFSGTATIAPECSNDGINWQAMVGYSSVNIGSSPDVSAFTQVNAGIYFFNIATNFLRFRVNAYTSGNIVINVAYKGGVIAPRSVWATLASGGSSVGGFYSLATAIAGGITSTTGIHRLLASAASVNATLVSAGARRAYTAFGVNKSASVKYLKLYNKATAPVPGTDVPVMTYEIPVGPFSLDFVSDIGVSFALGLGYAFTGLGADADTTALAAGDISFFHILFA